MLCYISWFLCSCNFCALIYEINLIEVLRKICTKWIIKENYFKQHFTVHQRWFGYNLHITEYAVKGGRRTKSSSSSRLSVLFRAWVSVGAMPWPPGTHSFKVLDMWHPQICKKYILVPWLPGTHNFRFLTQALQSCEDFARKTELCSDWTTTYPTKERGE